MSGAEVRAARWSGRLSLRASAAAGVFGGLVGISCCVSPVVLYLLGAATATEAVGLGNTLYYGYGWYFRAAGAVVGGTAIYLYLRRRNECDVRGVRANWRTIAGAAAIGLVTYASLYGLTAWLGSRASHG